MTRSTRGTALLSWLMLIAGGAALFACLFLPPWLEVRALRQEQAGAVQRIAQLEEQLERVAKQIEHLQNDPAYLERLAREEFGIDPPGVEIVRVTPRGSPTTEPAPVVGEPKRPEPLAAALERASHTNPLVAVFVLDETRPIVMAMSGILMIVALVLLLRGRASKPL